MPHEQTKTVFYFEELSDAAKERARQWYRDASMQDQWWDNVYEDAVHIAELLGIAIRPRNQRYTVLLRDGGTREGVDNSPSIFFSGFWSQGDGARFEGTYAYRADAVKAIAAHAPTDSALQRIAAALQHAHELVHGVSATIGHYSGAHYEHARTMEIEFSYDDEGDEGDYAITPGEGLARGQAEDLIRDALIDFANWIYKTLENEFEYQTADEQVDENITANEYEFYEDGERAV